MNRRWARFGLGDVTLGVGLCVAAVAFVLEPGRAGEAAGQSWRPFVLVTGLLVLGAVSSADGLFEAVGAGLAGRGTGDRTTLIAALALVAVVTAVLNLDTAVAFVTPVVVLAARRRGLAEDGVVYGSFFMANAASLLLPGSNLTNLLILAESGPSGVDFAARTWVAWLASVAVTALIVVAWFGRSRARTVGVGCPEPHPGTVPWSTVAAVGAAALVMIVLADAAVAVAIITVALVVARLRRGAISLPAVRRAVDARTVVGLFAVVVGLGTLARSWAAPSELLAGAGVGETAAIGALTAVAVNNLPAAVLLSSETVRHPLALLVGLNLGPNLAVSGSLSALLWFNAASSVGCKPSLLRVSVIGFAIVPASIAVSLLGLAATSSL